MHTKAGWDMGHIRNARHCPLTELLKGSVALPKDREVIAACGVGYRGTIAASFLQQQGFEHVHSLARGMKAWINGGCPVVTD